MCLHSLDHLLRTAALDALRATVMNTAKVRSLSYNSAEGLMYAQGFPGGSAVNNLPAKQESQEMWVQPLGQEDPLEEGMATPSSILAWKIPWTEEPGGLQSMGLQRARHN